MRFSTPTPRDRVLSFFLALILLLIGYFPTKAQYHKLKDFSSQQKASISNIENLETKQNSLKTLKNQWEMARSHEDSDKLALLLPSDPDLPNLAVNLDAIAKSSGLILYSFSTSSTATPSSGSSLNGAQPLALTVGLNGKVDYPLLKTILKAFEENLRIFEIESVAFSPSQASLNFQITTFFLPLSVLPNSPIPEASSSALENPSPRFSREQNL